MAITYSSGVYTLSSSGSYTPVDLYNNNSAGITRLNGSRVIYDFGPSRIIVQSGVTLTIDTDDTYGEIMFSDPGWNGSTYLHHIKVDGGILNLGSTTTRDALIVMRDVPAASYKDENRHIYIAGELNWVGGGLVFLEGGGLEVYNGSSGEISGSAWLYAYSGSSEASYIRYSEGGFNMLACKFYFAQIVPFVLPDGGESFEGLSFFDLPVFQPTVGIDNNGTNLDWMPCKGWDVSDSTVLKGFGFWDNRAARYINQKSGTDFVCKGNLANQSNNKGICEVLQHITFSAESGSGAKFYTKDTDNGNRLAANQILDNPDYEDDRTYTLTESGGSASSTGNGVLIGLHWRDTGGLEDDNNEFDSRGNADDHTDIFTWLKVQYGYQPATLDVVMKGTSAVQSSIVQLVDQGITESTRSTVAAYTGITPVFSVDTLTVTVDENHTLNEVYDYIKYWESANPDKISINGNTSFISTTNKLTYNYSNIVIVVDGVNLTCSEGQILPTKPTVESGGFFEDSEGAIWEDSGSLYYASHAYINVKDSDTSANIENAIIGWGDESTETRLLYNTSLVLDTLVTNSSGNAEGYFVYKIDSTTYASTKQITIEYSYQGSTIPRELDGKPIGSSSSYSTIRLAEDEEVTLSKANAALVSGITVDVATDTIDLNDNTLSDSYDNLKYQVTADADIDTGVPGCMYYCLFGLPLAKSGSTYTGRSSTTIYQNFDDGGTFQTGVIEEDTPNTYSSFTFGTVQFNFEADGTYDYRQSTFNGAVTVDTIGEYTVDVKFPLGTSVTNNDAGNITVETSTAIAISNSNLLDGTRVQLYNITQDTELENTTVAGGGGYTYNATIGAGAEIEVNDVIRLRATYVNGATAKANISDSQIATGGNIVFGTVQEDNAVYNSWAIDGSGVTEFAADYPNIEVDVTDGDGTSTKKRLGAWIYYIQTTEDGISNFYNAITTPSVAQITVNTDVVDLTLDNRNSAPFFFTDLTTRLHRDDGTTIIAAATVGPIGNDYSGVPDVVETGVSGLTAPESAKLMSALDSDDKNDINSHTTKMVYSRP